MKKLIMLFTMYLFVCGGCISETNTDPNTGLTTSRTVLDPNDPTLKGAETGVEALGNILLAFGVPFGSLLIGAGSVWKGLKPKIIAAQNQASEAERKEAIAKAAAQTTVNGVEELKKLSPESWKKLEPILVDMMKTAPSIEVFIRELRGLPVDLQTKDKIYGG